MKPPKITASPLDWQLRQHRPSIIEHVTSSERAHLRRVMWISLTLGFVSGAGVMWMVRG